ncbi:hypothetical protein SAMN05444362_12218 [Dysgonomonas macrotermitis]|uniref:Uncharacterized protein n=1 Tax=Dysgonomonas macrotermitis TaxID=1346286 RepID=A0A1M5J657_9BACT|nr:hypothetical protein SAMN05444362_12218 [Dysgonomonas macrotermitis]
MRGLYLDSMLTCRLDYEPSDAKMNVILLLGTNFIIRLLDLDMGESTHICNKLLENSFFIIRRLYLQI